MSLLHRLTICIIISIFIISVPGFYSSAAAAPSTNGTLITVATGSKYISVNGTMIATETVFKKGNIFYVPLISVSEAFGAETKVKSGGRVEVYFREVSIIVKSGTAQIEINKNKRKLPAPPVTRNNTLMVPAELFSTAFPSDIKLKAISSNRLSILLMDDGSLRDLSFLTGGIIKPRAGNSYFGWSIDVPKGSRILYQSFNSKSVQIDNEPRDMGIDVVVEERDTTSLEEYYKKILENPRDMLKAEILSSNINVKASPAYFDIKYSDEYDEAVVRRVFEGSKYFYSVILTSFEESDPSILFKDKLVQGILSSFKLGFKGGLSDTADLSSIKNGLCTYINLITAEGSTKKLSSWQILMIPEWDLINQSPSKPFISTFGKNGKEYITFELMQQGKEETSAELAKTLKDSYEKNFNPVFYKYLGGQSTKVASLDAFRMDFEVKKGNILYRYEEYLVIYGGLVYDITCKSEKDKYDLRKALFNKILSSFRPSTRDIEDIDAALEKYVFNLEKNRLGTDNSLVTYKNTAYSWSINLPGDWSRNSTSGKPLETFNNSISGAVIMVEALDRKKIPIDTSPESNLQIIKMLASMGHGQSSSEKVIINGIEIRKYKYRIESEQDENYADLYVYVFSNDKYYYAFLSSLPDLTSSQHNLSVMEAAWESFNF